MTSNLNLGSLTATQGFSLTGAPSASESGFSVSGAGDVNGDGYQDIIIGAPSANTNSGVSYVVYGNYTFPSTFYFATTALGIAGLYITGAAANDFSGTSVSGAGDFNGDGYDDIIIGADGVNSYTGAAYLIYGSASLPANLYLGSLGSYGFSITNSLSSYSDVGISVSAAGDINGDGYDDLVIGAAAENNNFGVSYAIYGSPSIISSIDLNNLGTQGIIISGSSFSRSGWSVNGAGDINNDSFADIIIGAPNNNSNSGAAYVIFGNKSLPSSLSLGNLGVYGFSISGAPLNSLFGYSVSGIGDVNGDSYDDIIIGTDGNSNAPAAYVIYGNKSFPNNINLMNLGEQGFNISNSESIISSYSVSGAGDVNNDGYDDIIIGATNTSESYVIYGDKSLPSSISLTNLGNLGFSLSGSLFNPDVSGRQVNGVGDVNNDSYADIIIGSPYSYSNSGASYIIYGAASGFVTSSPTSLPTSNPSSYPSVLPSSQPTSYPSESPSGLPSAQPSTKPSSAPTFNPTSYPTRSPSSNPTSLPSSEPSSQPSSNPSLSPSSLPSSAPSTYPSVKPTSDPTSEPTTIPSSTPTSLPSSEPSSQPSSQPIPSPTSYPSSMPTSRPSRPYEVVYNFDVQTALLSSISSVAGGIMLYLAPSFILKNWGYKFKYIYSETDKKNLQPHEIGIYKKEDLLIALHKKNGLINEYLLEINNGMNNGISDGLFKLIAQQLDSCPAFERNPATSPYKYLYNEAEASELKENEIGLKFTGNLPLLFCDIFCNSEKLIAFKVVDGTLRSFPLKIESGNNGGIAKTLYHAIAAEYVGLSNSVLTTLEENQIRDFLLVSGKLKPSIGVLQKIFCLYTPIFKDLGKAPGFFHDALNCNKHGPEILYDIVSFGGTIPGFLYGISFNFFKKYQVGINARISDGSFKDISVYIDSYLKSESETQMVTNLIHLHQVKKDDLENASTGPEIYTRSFEQASNSLDMIDTAKKPISKHTCIIQAVYDIHFDDPVINRAYQEKLGLASLKLLPPVNPKVTIIKHVNPGDNPKYTKESPSFEASDNHSPDFIISSTLNIRQAIEYIPAVKYLGQNILYPLIENHLPETAKNISLPEILDSKLFLFTAHLGLGSIGAMLLPHEIIYKGLIASTASSIAFGFRLAASDYLAEQKQEVLSNDRAMDAFEITKYCVSTILAYTAPAFLACALGQVVMPGYQCTELDLGVKLSFAGAECYSLYKATQAPTMTTTSDIVIPYVTYGAVAVTAYANGYSAMSILSSMVTTDWMSRLAIDMVSKEEKESYIDPILGYASEFCTYVYDNINQIVGTNHEL